MEFQKVSHEVTIFELVLFLPERRKLHSLAVAEITYRLQFEEIISQPDNTAVNTRCLATHSDGPVKAIKRHA